jgi:hypothetical protein
MRNSAAHTNPPFDFEKKTAKMRLYGLSCQRVLGNGGVEPDADLLVSLGALRPDKRWLTASLDKTTRLQLEAPPDFWLTFS